MSFECFSGGTQPGGNGGEGGVPGVAGRFAQFSQGGAPLDTALDAASVGDIALLWPDDAGLVGIWQKFGASDLRLISDCDLEQAQAAAVKPLDLAADFNTVWGTAPTWAAGGLQLDAALSTVNFTAAGVWPGTSWHSSFAGQFAQSGAGVGAHAGCGVYRSDSPFSMTATCITWVASRWSRRNAWAPTPAAAPLVVNSSVTSQTDLDPGDGPINGTHALRVGSLDPGTTERASFNGTMQRDPLANVEGYDSSVTQLVSGATYTTGSHGLAFVSNNGGSGTMSLLLQKCSFFGRGTR